jgi:hypothetical protein
MSWNIKEIEMKVEQPWNDARLKVTMPDGSIVFIGCVQKENADCFIATIQRLGAYEENIEYLLDSTKDAVRVKYKNGGEDFIGSLAANYISLRNTSNRRAWVRNEGEEDAAIRTDK